MSATHLFVNQAAPYFNALGAKRVEIVCYNPTAGVVTFTASAEVGPEAALGPGTSVLATINAVAAVAATSAAVLFLTNDFSFDLIKLSSTGATFRAVVILTYDD